MSCAVDIICSARNAGIQFAATIDSVLAQTYRDFRLIIIDDGSTDDHTKRIAQHAAIKDERVAVHRNDQSLGLTVNLVNHVARSQADFIARIDAGDRWLDTKLEKQLCVMRDSPDLLVLGTQCEYVSGTGERLGKSRLGESDEDLRTAIEQRRGVFTHPSIIFRRAINYRRQFLYSQDLDLYLRASEKGKLQCLSEALTLVLIDPNGITLEKKYLQRQYGNLAYRCQKARIQGVEEPPLTVRDNACERQLWRCARPFYQRYIAGRNQGKSTLVWGAYLLLSLLIFPPLIGDYLRKL